MKLHTFIALITSVVFVFIQTTKAQTLITVQSTEGDTNLFIPCQFTDGTVPFWKINDTLYHHTRLPCPFVVSTAPNGINIALLERSFSGTSFQCFASRNGMIMTGDIRVLTVNENPAYNGDGQGNNATTPALTVDLIYQQTRFTESGISLSWSLFNKNYVADSPPGSSSVIYTSTCDVSNASVAANTTNTYAVLSPRDEYDDDYFNITAFDENREQIGTVDEPIRINSGVETNGISLSIGSTCPVCFTVPQPGSAPFFNIPRSTNGNQRDSLCTVLRTQQEINLNNSCLNLASSCPDFSTSQFSSSVTVCSSTTSTTDYQMCLSNITREMNGTKFHFFYSSQPNCPITQSRQRSSLFIASYEIVAEDLPGNLTVTTNTSSGELCIASLPRGCYATTVYNISISDVTGSLVYTERNIQDDVCIQVNLLQTPDSECAPYTIAVDAYNPHVTYQTVYHTVGEDHSSSFCDCARGKAEVELTKSAISEIELTCNTNTSLKFSIVVVDMKTELSAFSSELKSCATRTLAVPLQNLACNRQYSVSAHLAFGNGTVTDCLLSTTVNVSEECPTIAPTISPTVVPVVAIAVSIVVVLVLILIVTIIVILVIVWYRKKSSGVYRPGRRERQQSQGQTAMDDIKNQTEEGRGFKLNNETEINNNEEP